MTLGYPTSDVILGLKDQRSRSQGHKAQLQKHIEGDPSGWHELHTLSSVHPLAKKLFFYIK